MKKAFARIFAGLLIVGVVLMWYPTSKTKPTAVLAQTNSCQLTSLNGTYGFAFSGYVNTKTTGLPVYTPIAAAGTITFHADGTLSRAFNASFGGTIFSVNDSGSYSLDANDCNFTANLPEAGETWNLIPVAGGAQIDFFVNPGPRIGAGTLARQ